MPTVGKGSAVEVESDEVASVDVESDEVEADGVEAGEESDEDAASVIREARTSLE